MDRRLSSIVPIRLPVLHHRLVGRVLLILEVALVLIAPERRQTFLRCLGCRMHADNVILDLVKLLVEFLDQVLVGWLDGVCLVQLLAILLIIRIILQLSILLQPLLSIFD